MKDLTIIIPIREYESSMDELLNRAVESCGENNIILIGKNVEKYKTNAHIKKIENTSDNLDYQHNVNVAVDSVDTKYFSVLEYDDYFSKNWFNNVEKYIEIDTEEISGFLPLTEIVDFNEKKVIGYSNEVFWASSFSEEIGYLDMESMMNYLHFNTSGAVFKKDDFVSLGGLKESMKLVFWYEYLLRALYNNKRLYVIPKVGYYHVIGRDGSMTSEYTKTITEKEADWLVDLAKKEYFFKKDRNKTYEGE